MENNLNKKQLEMIKKVQDRYEREQAALALPPKVLVTGITGQDSSYMCELLLEKGYEVHGTMRRSSTPNTSNVNKIISTIKTHLMDLSDATSINKVISEVKPDLIFCLAAQSDVRASYDIPEYTLDVTGLGFGRILEAVRQHCPQAKIYQAGSSEMFGKVEAIPQCETTPFHPRSPYGCAKVLAFSLGRAYREGYGMKVYNGILFNHECVTAQTPVIIKQNGLIDIVPIEEVVPHRENPKHGKKYTTEAIDLEIWNGGKWSKVKLMSATYDETKIIHSIEVRGGYYEATSDHVSFLEDEKEIQTKDVKIGDKMQLKPLPLIENELTITKEEAEMIGMIVGDGYVCDSKARFSNNSKELQKIFSDLWFKVTGGNTVLREGVSGFKNTESHYLNLYGNPSYLRYIENEIYTEKRFKRIPKRILNSNPVIWGSFLKGYNTCDGLKAGKQKTLYKSFTTNSQTLASGLWLLMNNLNYRTTLHTETRNGKKYYHININSKSVGNKGKHLRKELNEVKANNVIEYNGWLFDLETEDGTFSAGIGNTWVHNSPRRGHLFVTRKIVKAAVAIKNGTQKKLKLGNLEAKRDWGSSLNYMQIIYKMVTEFEPQDFVVATGETHTIREFVEEVFNYIGLGDWRNFVEYDQNLLRPAEVDLLLGDMTKVKELFGYDPIIVKFKDLVKWMVDSEMKETI